jgi:hypothetical protein
MKLWLGALVAVAVIVAVGGVVLHRSAPSSTAQDTSCHYPFRGGATRVAPKFVADLAIADDEWDAVTSVLADFAREHAWDFKDTSHVQPGVVKVLGISLCSDTLRISLVEQRWARQNYAHPIPGRGISLALYGDAPPPEWQGLAAELVLALESKWPNKVRFRDRDGRYVERPPYLREG